MTNTEWAEAQNEVLRSTNEALRASNEVLRAENAALRTAYNALHTQYDLERTCAAHDIQMLEARLTKIAELAA